MALSLGSDNTVVTSGQGAATISYDATVGPRISSFTIPDTVNGDLTVYPCDDTGDLNPQPFQAAQGGLWVLEVDEGDLDAGRPAGPRRYLTPANATTYEHYTGIPLAGGGTAELLTWRGVRLVDTDSFWVRVAVIDSGQADEGVQFAMWAGHEEGDRNRILTYVCPALNVRHFSTGGSNEFEAACAQRVFVPGIATLDALHLKVNNFSLGAFARRMPTFGTANFGVPLSTLTGDPDYNFSRYSGNVISQYGEYGLIGAYSPADAGVHLKVLGLYARQPEPSRCFWRLLQFVPGRDATENYHLVWHPRTDVQWVAEWGVAIEDDPETDRGVRRPFLRNRNGFGPHLTFELQGFTASDDQWWFDGVKRYRDYYKAAYSPVPAKNNPQARDFRHKPALMIVDWPSVNWRNRVLNANDGWRESIIRNKYILEYMNLNPQRVRFGPNNALMHFQVHHYAVADFTGNMNGREDGSDAWEVLDWLPEMSDAGFACSLYVHPNRQYLLSQGWVNGPEDLAVMSPRERIPIFTDQVNLERPLRDIEQFFDIRGKTSNRIMARQFEVLIRRHGLRAGYWDNPSGFEAGVNNAYEHGASFTWTTERNKAFALVKNTVENFAIFAETGWQGAEEVLDAFTSSVTVLNGVCGPEWEAAFIAQLWAEDGIALPSTLTDVPFEARIPHVNSWLLLHNDTLGGEVTYALQPSLSQLSTAPGVISGGCTPAELRDALCWAAANSYVGGRNSMLWIQDSQQVNLPLIVDAIGSPNEALDPGGVCGPPTMAFMRNLVCASTPEFAGPFIGDGLKEKFFTVDYSSPNVTMLPNPSTPTKDLERPNQPPYVPFFHNQYRNPPLVVNNSALKGLDLAGTRDEPAVVHSVWKDDTGRVGLVLVNWSNADASWRGTFFRARYGFTGNVNVHRLTQTLFSRVVAPTLLGQVTGASAVVGNGSGVDIDIGTLPARSIHVITFTAVP